MSIRVPRKSGTPDVIFLQHTIAACFHCYNTQVSGIFYRSNRKYGRYAYEVDSCRSRNVTAEGWNDCSGDGTVLVNLGDSDDRLYMYTCLSVPDISGATDQRYVVRATLIPESETINLSALSTDDDDYVSINKE